MNACWLIRLVVLVIGLTTVTGDNSVFSRHVAQTGIPPHVLEAVAPIFIPFVFDKTGMNEVVVEVNVNSDGNVTSAKTVSVTLFRDTSFETTAKRWRFAPSSDGKEERIAQIKFILRIMPKDTPLDQLTTIYTAPYQIEVRHEVFEPQVTSAPIPNEMKRGQRKKKKK